MTEQGQQTTPYADMVDRLAEKTRPIRDEHREVLDQFKGNTEMTDEERLDHYRNEVYPKFEEAHSKAAEEFVAEVAARMHSLEQTVFGGKTSPQLSSHLVALANVTDDRLGEVMSTAVAAGDPELERAVVLAARQRGVRDVVNAYVERVPERKAAHDELNTYPSIDRLEAITNGYKFPKADARSLAATFEAGQAASREEIAKQSQRRKFYDN